MSRVKKILKWILSVLGVLLGALALFLLFSYLRPNQAQVNPSVVTETWPIVNDSRHNSNTDLIEWNGNLYLIHASAPFHFASAETCLSLKRSSGNARTWEEVTRFGVQGEDNRDPTGTSMAAQLC